MNLFYEFIFLSDFILQVFETLLKEMNFGFQFRFCKLELVILLGKLSLFWVHLFLKIRNLIDKLLFILI